MRKTVKGNLKSKTKNQAVGDTDVVTLTRSEYEELKKSESKAKQFKAFKLIILWTIVIIFGISIYVAITNKIIENNEKGIKLDSYFENDLKRVQGEIDSSLKSDLLVSPKVRNNYRPGRLYHRGGKYGRNENQFN